MAANHTPHDLDTLTSQELKILRRISKGLTDREIALQLYLSLNTVKWYNRQIYSKLGVANRRQAAALAAQQGLLKTPPATGDLAAPKTGNNLPAQLTSFIGRTDEVGDIVRLLRPVRLLTLTGPGGVGKTRLALEAAQALAEARDFTDGVHLVELAPIRDPAMVAGAIAEALSISESPNEETDSALEKYLRGKQILLVMDNFEHLLDGAPLLADLLRAAPGLKVLATSRERLNLTGEISYAVFPLEQAAAVALFRARAQAVKPGLDWDESELAVVERIAERLERLPLAIELAAARIALLSPAVLLHRLGERIDLLMLQGRVRDKPERHRTMQAALDWSYELLDAQEQALFNRLAIFAGGCTLEAAEAVCGEGLDIAVLDGLESLLHKSLVRVDDEARDEARLKMLETIREYALGKLEDLGETRLLRDRHTAYFTALAEQAEPEMGIHGENAGRWIARIERELENFRLAFDHSMSGDAEAGLRMLSALRRFWFTRRPRQGLRWVEWGLARAAEVPLELQARTHYAAAMILSTVGDQERARPQLEQAVNLLRKSGDPPHLAKAIARLAKFELEAGAIEAAARMLEESLALFRELGDPAGVSFVLHTMGELARIQGRYEQARANYEASLAARIESQEPDSATLFNLASVSRRLGDLDRARILYLEALQSAFRVGRVGLVGFSLAGLAGVLASQEDAEMAARLLGADQALRERSGHRFEAIDLPDYERSLADTRDRLEAQAFEAAWKEGAEMRLEEAIALAQELGSTATDPESP